MNGQLNELAQLINANARAKGFYENKTSVCEHLMLVNSELCEAMEADRTDDHCKIDLAILTPLANDNFIPMFEDSVKNTFEDEVADAMIRLLDLCCWQKIDIEAHIKAKMRYNQTRSHMHGKKY